MDDNIIKMFIGGEEVVSNKEFTINEEMLSASSTILNNCYPASWEESKDYVSNFYYPKDYSKFILGKGNFTYGTDQYYILTVSGETFMQFTTNVEKELAGFIVYGNTYQETRSGKNMLNVVNTTTTTNGITFTVNNDNSITINGTSTATTFYNINFNPNYYINLENGKTYTISTGITLPQGISITTRQVNPNLNLFSIGYNSKEVHYTATNNYTAFTYIYIPSGYTFNNLTLYLQIEENTQATFYEQYGMSPSPDYPSELVSVGYENLFDKDNANVINAYLSGSKTIVASNNDRVIYIPCEANTTYFVSKMVQQTTSSNRFALGTTNSLPAANNSLIDFTYLGNGTTNTVFSIKTSANTKYLVCGIYHIDSLTTFDEMKNSIQITKNKNYPYISYGKYGIELQCQSDNLFNLKDTSNIGTNVIVDDEDWITVEVDNTNGSTTNFQNYFTNNLDLKTSTNYFIVIEVKNVSGSGNLVAMSNLNNQGQFTGVINYSFANLSNNIIKIDERTTKNSFENVIWGLRTYIQFSVGQKGSITFRLSVVENIDNFKYMPYEKNSQLYVLNEPLRKINNYSDKLYITNNKLYIERKIKKIDMSTITGWGRNTDGAFYRINFNNDYGIIANTIFSNIFTYSTSVWSGDGKFGITPSNNLWIMTGDTTLTNVNLVSNWLANKNAYMYGILAESFIEELGSTNLPIAYNGKNNIQFNTGLETTEDVNYYWKNYDVLFAGIVKNSGDISLRPTNPKYCSLQILDYKTFLSESDTLDFVISDKTIAEAITMVVDAISGYGFILGTINISQADDIIGAYSTLNKTAYDVFQYLANISGSRWRARFVDSDTMAIDFYDPELLPRANNIDYTQQYWEDNKIVDLTFNYGTRDYRNKQIILSDEVYGGIDYTEVLLSNGYGTNYITQNNIANITSITVNGVEAEVITQSEKDLGVDADFYYTPGKNVVESTTSYTAGTQIIITYTPLVKGRQIVYNDEEVTRIATQTNTTGVISRYENRNDILSSDELENIAETYIKYKGKPEIILKLTTLNNDLFNIGEICYFNSPIADLAQDYMVKSKATNYTTVAGETNIFYTYELTSSFNSEKAINYFDNQRNKATGNIAEGESITRNIDINNSAMIIWENATITEISVSVDGDNALNSVLNSPFIQ